MSDIVERLRALQHFDVCYPVPHPTCEEAAACIERLRAALREIKYLRAQKKGSVSYAMASIASAALGETGDDR